MKEFKDYYQKLKNSGMMYVWFPKAIGIYKKDKDYIKNKLINDHYWDEKLFK